MALEGTELQELALRIAQLPQPTQLKLLQTVLTLTDLESAPITQSPLSRTMKHLDPESAPKLESQILACIHEEKLQHREVVLLGALVFVTRESRWDAPFGTEEINEIVGEAWQRSGKTKINVHTFDSLVGGRALERIFQRRRLLLFRFTDQGWELAQQALRLHVPPKP